LQQSTILFHTSTELIDHLFKKYREGFYVHLPKESRITNKRRIARYVARYIWHPAVANTRLHRYDGKTVTFWYKDREGKRHFVTMEVREFIKALIQHIPDRNFKMIRYYGAYSRKTKRRYSGSDVMTLPSISILSTFTGCFRESLFLRSDRIPFISEYFIASIARHIA
jgi:hypothetical protein